MRISSSVGSGLERSSAVAEIEHPRGAEPALHARLLEERPLERSDLLVAGETLHRRDIATLRLQREVRARVHRLAVEEHHARAALGVVAAFLGAGEAELLARRLQQADVRIELDRIVGAVHAEGRSHLHRRSSTLPCSAGLAGIGTLPAARTGERGGDRAVRDDLGHRAAVVGGPAHVADRGGGRRGGGRSRPRPPRRHRRCRSAPTRPRGRAGSSGVSAVMATRASAIRSPSTVTTAVAPTTAISIWRRYSSRT